MIKWLPIGLLALAAAEISVFVLVAAVIGLPQVLGLLLAASFAGVIVLLHPGRARIERLRVAVTQSGIRGLEAGGEAFLTVSAGFLLLLPGFITDVLGLILLLPPVRRWIGGRFRRFAQQSQGHSPAVVDLDRSDWSQVPQSALQDSPPRNEQP